MPVFPLGIAEVCARYGVSPRTLRYYEDEGLLTPSRTGWARTYSMADCIRLEVILKGKRLQFSIAEIRKFLGVGEAETSGCCDVLDAATKAEVFAQINRLQRRRNKVQEAIEQLTLELSKRTR